MGYESFAGTSEQQQHQQQSSDLIDLAQEEEASSEDLKGFIELPNIVRLTQRNASSQEKLGSSRAMKGCPAHCVCLVCCVRFSSGCATAGDGRTVPSRAATARDKTDSYDGKTRLKLTLTGVLAHK
jgi:hypothetical protein